MNFSRPSLGTGPQGILKSGRASVCACAPAADIIRSRNGRVIRKILFRMIVSLFDRCLSYSFQRKPDFQSGEGKFIVADDYTLLVLPECDWCARIVGSETIADCGFRIADYKAD